MSLRFIYVGRGERCQERTCNLRLVLTVQDEKHIEFYTQLTFPLILSYFTATHSPPALYSSRKAGCFFCIHIWKHTLKLLFSSLRSCRGNISHPHDTSSPSAEAFGQGNTCKTEEKEIQQPSGQVPIDTPKWVKSIWGQKLGSTYPSEKQGIWVSDLLSCYFLISPCPQF